MIDVIKILDTRQNSENLSKIYFSLIYSFINEKLQFKFYNFLLFVLSKCELFRCL